MVSKDQMLIHQQRVIERQQAQIRELDDELTRARLKAGAGGVAVDTLVEQAVREQRELKNTIDALQAKVEALETDLAKYMPDFIRQLPVSDQQYLDCKTALEAQDVRITEYKRRTQYVGVTIVVMDSNEFYKPVEQRRIEIGRIGPADYPGVPNSERVKEELTSQIKALAYRAPLWENFKGPLVHGVPPEVQYKVVCDMAPYWHESDLNSHFDEMLRYFFDHFIKEYVDPDMTEVDAYDYLRKSVMRSYTNQGTFQRGATEKPRSRKPRSRK